jgi:branched-chain amino acid transport system substrate-binding protein
MERIGIVKHITIPAADDLTQRDKDQYSYLIRTGWTSSQPSRPLGQWICDQGYKRIAAIGADYAFGYDLSLTVPRYMKLSHLI